MATQAGPGADGASAPASAPAGAGVQLETRPPAVVVSGLTKSYGDIEAVRGIDFEVAPGETFGFLGPNGAGKSTTIKILCTLARPTSGRASVAGHDVASERVSTTWPSRIERVASAIGSFMSSPSTRTV